MNCVVIHGEEIQQTERNDEAVYTVTFAGHREVYQSGVKDRLDAILNELVQTHQHLLFYVGGMGDYDKMCASAVRELKRRNPNNEIQLVLVEPYMKQSINEEGEYLHMMYDEILIPMELAGIHYKKAITERNRWMVRESNLLIAYVHRDFGGARTMMKYAQKLGKEVINTAQ